MVVPARTNIWAFEYAHNTMQGNGKMRDAYRLDHSQYYKTLYDISRGVLPMWLKGTDMKVGEISRA